MSISRILMARVNDMTKEDLVLVVPKPYIPCYPKECRSRILTVADFIQRVKDTQIR